MNRTIQTVVDPDEKEKFKAMAKSRGTTPSELVRDLLRKELEQHLHCAPLTLFSQTIDMLVNSGTCATRDKAYSVMHAIVGLRRKGVSWDRIEELMMMTPEQHEAEKATIQ